MSVWMVNWGGQWSDLPDSGVHTYSFLGGGVSGYVLANGFGRSEFWGWMLAALSACVATVLGVLIGGAILTLFAGGNPEQVAFFGVVAIAYSVEI